MPLILSESHYLVTIPMCLGPDYLDLCRGVKKKLLDALDMSLEMRVGIDLRGFGGINGRDWEGF